MGKTAKSGQAKSKAKAKAKSKQTTKEDKKSRAPKEMMIPETTMEKFDFLSLARSMASQIKDIRAPMSADGVMFEENPLREGCETAVTYDGAFASIMHLKPRYFILENVSGARMPAMSGASDSKKSPLDSYLDMLGTRLPEYSVTTVMVDASPLPERRERVFILGSSAADLDAMAWGTAVECLQRFAAGKPKHHVQTLLSLGDPTPRDGAEETVKVAGKRISDLYPDVLKTTARLAATPGANEILIDSMCKAAAAQGAPPSMPKLADLSQSVGRGSVWIHGTIGTLTTSTTYFSYDHSYDHDRFVEPEDHLRILGWDGESIKLASQCLSKAELQEAAGNGMSWAAVLKVLLPMLMRMGFLSDLLK
ncbi:hypothetical protein AK812_SmicGene13578 [Symbiodinium microadriaticum]|uniref:Uncharacterized protein n=1 Tax=Symbiodinium microadriaticum TaxID=2951 RepID=A0A1Q9E7T6_SYMMI|nr:hypothetical protein AK812_SmicGene13578 [Symbiodinium microadriaticum]CAE7257071.1 unnamed protein product [Symbiodinium sp. KB8]CAE7767721.1 unnamed protein product [Symbiodinium microadriaticum]